MKMYNTNGVRECGELLEISKDRFRTKKHSMFGNTCVCGNTYIFYDETSQIPKQIEWQTKHWTIVSDLLPLTLVLIKER